MDKLNEIVTQEKTLEQNVSEISAIRRSVQASVERLRQSISQKGIDTSSTDGLSDLVSKVGSIKSLPSDWIKTKSGEVHGVDIKKGDAIIYQGGSNMEDGVEAIIDPLSELPTGNSMGCDFSPDGRYIVVSHYNQPYISIYKIDKETNSFVKLPNPDALPTGHAKNCSFSHDGQYLAIAHNTAPYVTLYKVDIETDTFTKLPNLSEGPTNHGISCKFSPCGSYFVISFESAPYMSIYGVNRATDDFTKLLISNSLPPGNVYDFSFSPCGKYLAVGHYNSPYLTVYKVSVNSFTKLSFNPGLSDMVSGCDFSRDSSYLLVSINGSLTTQLYSVDSSKDFITKANYSYSSQISGIANGCTFSPCGDYYVLACQNAPRINIYKIQNVYGEIINAKLPTPMVIPTGVANDCKFSSDGKYLAIVHAAFPCLTVYNTEPKEYVFKYDNQGALLNRSSNRRVGIATDDKNVGEQITVDLFEKLTL